MLSGMGETRDSSIETFQKVKNNFDDVHIKGLEKTGVVDDDGGDVGDGCKKRKVFAPFDSVPDGSKREGLRRQNVTNVKGKEGMVGGTVAAKMMLLPSAGKATEVQNPIPLNFAWSYPASVADSTDTGNAEGVDGGIETTKEDWNKLRISQHTKESYKTDYQMNYRWWNPQVEEYGVSEPHHDDNTIEKVQVVEQNHEIIKPEPPMLQLRSPTTQQRENKEIKMPMEGGEGEISNVDSIESEMWNDNENVGVPVEATADYSTLQSATTTLMKRKEEEEDVMDKGTMTSGLSGVMPSIEGSDNDEKPDYIRVNCDEIEQEITNGHGIDGAVHLHSNAESSQIFPRAAYNHLNYGGTPHILPTFRKKEEEDNVARLLCAPGYSAGRGSRSAVNAAYLCRLRDAINQSKYLVRTSEVAELCRLRKPPVSIVKLFGGACRVLGIPRMKWMSLRMFFLRNRCEIVQAIHNLNVDSSAVNCNNLAFCGEQWAQLSNISKASRAVYYLSAWLHLLYAYARAKDGYLVVPSPLEIAKPRHAQITSSPSRKRSEELLPHKAERSPCRKEKTPTVSRTATITSVVHNNNKTSHDDPIAVAEGFAQKNYAGKLDGEPKEDTATNLREKVDQHGRQIRTSNVYADRTTSVGLKTSAPANATSTPRKRVAQNIKKIEISKSATRSKPFKPPIGPMHSVPKDNAILARNEQRDHHTPEIRRIKAPNEQPHADHSATKGVVSLSESSAVHSHHQWPSKFRTTWPHYANPAARRPTQPQHNPILNNPRFPPGRMKYCSEYDLNFTWPRD